MSLCSGLAALLLCAATAAAPSAPAPAAPAPNPPLCPAPLRLLAFGDSLTNGAVPSLNANHPYTLNLGRLLEAELRRRVQITTAAANSAGALTPGDPAVGEPVTLASLLDRTLARARGGGVTPGVTPGVTRPYDIIVVMAGINDLGRGNRSATDVLGAVERLLAAAGGAATTAVVVVSPWANRFVARSSDNEAQRLRFAAALKQYVASNPRLGGANGPRLLLDEAASGPLRFWDMPPEARRKLQDDELHLTPAGYDLLGGHLFGTVLNGGALAALKCSDAGSFAPDPKAGGAGDVTGDITGDAGDADAAKWSAMAAASAAAVTEPPPAPDAPGAAGRPAASGGSVAGRAGGALAAVLLGAAAAAAVLIF